MLYHGTAVYFLHEVMCALQHTRSYYSRDHTQLGHVRFDEILHLAAEVSCYKQEEKTRTMVTLEVLEVLDMKACGCIIYVYMARASMVYCSPRLA